MGNMILHGNFKFYKEMNQGRLKRLKLVKKISVFTYIKYMFCAISIISIVVLIVLNTTITYKYIIYRYNLVTYTGLSSEILMDNYKTIIYYLQNPFSKELSLEYFPMSNFGKIHFGEVKQIFIALYIISIGFIIVITIKLITNKNNNLKKMVLNTFNSASNIILIFIVSISLMSVVDFSKIFNGFHKIFFRNDYWIFDPRIDSVINALPQELFIIELGLIITFLIIFIVIVKALYYNNHHRSHNGH